MRAMELRSPRMFLPIRPNFLGLLEVEACATGGMGHCPEGHLHSCVHLRDGQNPCASPAEPSPQSGMASHARLGPRPASKLMKVGFYFVAERNSLLIR
jgi:hypothetical protein